MSRIASIISVAILFAITIASTVSAATEDMDIAVTPTKTTQATETPLLLNTVSVLNATGVTLTFNQAIQVDSLRVRIIDQASNESIKIASITGATTPTKATITTASSLTAGASYVLTITSALSTTDMTIKAGIDSIREFAVPVTLPGATFNAPSNPNAVIVTTGATSTGKTTTTGATSTGTKSGSATGTLVPKDVGVLPATGTPTSVLILLAAISAFGLLFLRKRA